MLESDYHEGPNLNCYQTEDVRNWTDRKIADEMLTSAFETSLLLKAFTPMTFVIGFIGNVAFLLVLARVKTMRTITNFYLANLAIADLTTLSSELVYQSWQYVKFKQVKSDPINTSFGCGLFYFTTHLSSLSSIFLITIISFDRYLAICHPLKYRTMKIKKQASYILTLLAWIISAILCFVRSLASSRLVYECILWPSREKYKYFPDIIRHCKPIHQFFHVEILEHVVHSAPFIAALITNSIINIRIVQKLTRPPPGENGNHQNQQIKQRITWMLLANSIIFFSCLAPVNFSVNVLEAYESLRPSTKVLWKYCLCFSDGQLCHQPNFCMGQLVLAIVEDFLKHLVLTEIQLDQWKILKLR